MAKARKSPTDSQPGVPARPPSEASRVGPSAAGAGVRHGGRARSAGAQGDGLAQPQVVEWFWPRYRASEDRWRVVGAALRVLRTDRYLSASEVADRAGLSRPYLTQIETGARRPPEQVVQRLLEAMGTGGGDLDVAAERTGMLIPEQLREQMGLWTDEFGRVHRRGGRHHEEPSAPSVGSAVSGSGQAPSDLPPVQAGVTRASARLTELVRVAAALDEREMGLLLVYASGLAGRPAPLPSAGGNYST